MKTLSFCRVGALIGSLVLTAQVTASPGGFSGRVTSYQNYASDGVSEYQTDPVLQGGPRRWSFGAYGELQRRRVSWRQPRTSAEWDTDNAMFSAGYDFRPWITLLGAVGRSELEIGQLDYSGDSIWLLGARMRWLDFFVFDPFKTSDLYWCRIDSAIHYWDSEGSRDGANLEWNELRANVTLGFVTRPNRLGYLDSAGLYVGPAFSRLKGRETLTGWRNSVKGKDDFGVVAGIFINPNRNTVLKAEMLHFERNSLNLSAGFHF